MKKTLKIFAFAVIALAALASCAKDQFKENAIPAGEKIQVSINGQIGEFTSADVTKATAGSVVRVTWENGDKVYVYDGSSASLDSLTVTPDEDNASYALLSGTITASSASPAPTKLTLVYVKGATVAPAIVEGKILVDLSIQDEAEVPFVLYTTIGYDADKLSKAGEYISFKFATSVMTVGCTDLQTNAGSAIAISKAEIDGVSTVCELAVTGSGVTVAGAKTGKITRIETAEPSVFTQSDSRGSFKLALAADPAAPAARNIIVHQGSKVSGAAFTSTTLAAGKSYNTVYQMCEYIAPPAGILPGVFTVADPDGTPNSGDETKVHFSQGNLHATWNGSEYTWNFADNQYDVIGNAAGNTTIDSQTNDAIVDLFGWSTGSTNYGINTSTDNSTYSGEFVDWGKAYCASNSIAEGTWRTLSIDEWTYLFSKHSGKWISVNGVGGYVIAPDDFSGILADSYEEHAALAANGLVFIPAAGMRTGSCVSDVSSYGIYWSSSNCVDEPGDAYYKDVYDGCDEYPDAYKGQRSGGFSVRLVTEASGGYAPAVKVSGVSLNKTKTTIEAGAAERLVAAVAPADATNKQVTWKSSDEDVATVENGEVTGVAAGSAVITATTADGNFTAVCIVTVTSKSDYVVMKMSRGDSEYTLKWRTMNLGATTVAGSYATCYGDLYQWGSLYTIYVGSPYTSATTGSFTFKEGKSDGFHPSSMEYYGEDDLTLANDVANKILGSGYRIPTSQEFKDLYDACGGDDKFDEMANPGKDTQVGQGTYWCDNYDNVAGVLFCDGTNKLFFPAAGFGYNTGLVDAGSYGYYLSSNIVPDAFESAYDLLFCKDWKYVTPQSTYSRHSGVSIRPVLD